jgi:S-DNA-T family DNA segregation ATPase FtsK/SpoIIIE
MAKKNKRVDIKPPVSPKSPVLAHDAKKSLFAVLFLALGAISFLGLCKSAGPVGDWFNYYLTLGLGFGKWFFPLFMAAIAVFLFGSRKFHIKKIHYLALFLLFLTVQCLLHFFIPQADWKQAMTDGYGGGWLGYFLTAGIQKFLGFAGGLVVLVGLFFAALILLFNTTLSQLIGYESWFGAIGRFFAALWSNFLLWQEQRAEARDIRAIEREAAREASRAEELAAEKIMPVEIDKSAPVPVSAPGEIVFTKKKIGKEVKETKAESGIKEKSLAKNWKSKPIRIDVPLDLLSAQKNQGQGGDITHNQALISRTLENFGINVEMGETSVGPTVTQYTFKPAEGIKLSRITALSNDLSLALAAHPIRIEAPIPGKALVGIEVPNKIKATVGLREILEDKEFKQRKNNMLIALGKDVAGANWLYDLTRMPHLLVAGATNSGKSVCLNAIIVSLLYQNSPEDMRFIMVDPKRVELPIYNGIPHLLTPVITEVNKTINALKWCLNEMDRRYDILNKAGKKNIQNYNEQSGEKMAYIIFVVDELADLMVTSAKDIEGSIIRLTQMARAVGIHLILSTQRPSVDVITGLIKANTPARVAFAVASAVDSKTILDVSGAEKLLGKGDMLFSTAELSKPKRIQGAYVSDEEITRITNFIRTVGGEPQYIEGVTERQKVAGNAGIGLDGTTGDEDELMNEAKEIIIGMGRASTSMLQRRLRIGYGRAASILDMLEEAGIIGPVNGARPREVLITKEQFERQQNSGGGVSAMPVHNRAEASAPDAFLGGDIKPSEEGNDDTLDFEGDDEPEESLEPEEEPEDEKIEDEFEDAEPKIDQPKLEPKQNPVAPHKPTPEEEEEMFFAR